MKQFDLPENVISVSRQLSMNISSLCYFSFWCAMRMAYEFQNKTTPSEIHALDAYI